MSEMQGSMLEEVLAHEHRVWQALVAGDRAADTALLAEDFVGLYPDGYAGRDDHSGQLANGPTVSDYALSEIRMIPLAPDVVILTYLAQYRRPGAARMARMWVSSTWRRGPVAGWINLFSQDTPAEM
ncbi:nuclear transport factor 2 family protein [Gemmobacter serpentinus]|uniref:nuclear transport factor 2 family protein n=1 Tax=Gemmobacter serpentinus TaxID=2652247 RepID=UPI00124EA273|nr:nuclear transport factor 2 family protein [Gemmobacter serpentinus]